MPDLSGTAGLNSPVQTSAQRVLVIGGLLLIAAGMLFGDIFAIFVLHPNNARIGEAMYSAAQMIPAGNVDGIMAQFQAIGGFLENRGTKVDTHSHIIHLGYIALLLAILQPWVNLSELAKKRLAYLYITSATLMPPAIFSIHYVGLAYSPLSHIGWGSIFADFFGALLSLCVLIYFWGLLRQRGSKQQTSLSYLDKKNTASRRLLVGGLLLLACGFLYGAGMAAWLKSGFAASELEILKAIVTHAASAQQDLLNQDFADFGQYQMLRGIHRATHAHINEIAILLLLLSLIQPFIYFKDSAQTAWATTAVIGAFTMPVGLLLEIPYGIVGSIIVDTGGFIVIVALVAMLFGLLRHTGATDSQQEKLS